ncbi:MAG: hypothetical protein J5J06_05660 [Phycisphaerae bacterium]|nr:hypothetical protein [Phycisphaerae bacterium]
MGKQLKPAGMPLNVWTPINGKAPAEWKRNEIPKSPGEYQLICTDDNGDPIKFPVRSDLDWDDDSKETMEKEAEFYQGVVYIGMTTCLHCRFWQLVRSWSNDVPKKLHDSRKTWDEKAELQKLYKVENMLCRYRRISMQDWHKKHAADVAEILDACWPDRGTNHEHQSAAAAITAESFSLLKWEKCFGKPAPDNLPPLNKEQAERGGDEITDEWLAEHFSEDDCLDEE